MLVNLSAESVVLSSFAATVLTRATLSYTQHTHGCPFALALSFHSFPSYYPPRLPFNHRERHTPGLQPPYACHKGPHASSGSHIAPFTDLPSHVRKTLPFTLQLAFASVFRRLIRL